MRNKSAFGILGILGCMLLALPTAGFPQSRQDMSWQDRMAGGEMQARSAPLSFEAISLFDPDTSKTFVNLHYRIPRSYFVFVKSSDPAAPKEEFTARGQLVVELFNAQNVSVAREIRPIALVRIGPSGVTDQAGEGDVEGAVSFTLAKGEYQIVFEADDLESGRSMVDKKRTIKAQNIVSKSLEISVPFFARVDTNQRPGISFIAFNHGKNVLFGGSHGGIVSQVFCPRSDSGPTIEWTLRGQTDNRSPRTVMLKGTRFDVAPGRLSLVSKEGPVVYRTGPASPEWKVVYVPLPLEKLDPGSYTVELLATIGTNKSSQNVSFQVQWPGRPMSLTDWDVAIDALRYIATPAEVDEMLSATREQGQILFQAFWKKRDPDTTTAYNEMMVEYYRRVDEATRRFSTSKEGDGYRTDRGRIYVLFGPPTNVQRSLLPGQPAREIWTYDNVKRRFVFVEKNKSGNYILTETSNL